MFTSDSWFLSFLHPSLPPATTYGLQIPSQYTLKDSDIQAL